MQSCAAPYQLIQEHVFFDNFNDVCPQGPECHNSSVEGGLEAVSIKFSFHPANIMFARQKSHDEGMMK
jgi:hypothetical protein